MRASLNFTLPDDQYEFDAALCGQRALMVLAEIEKRCREVVKYCDQSESERTLASNIRTMIPADLLEIL
jgi:hypothetical protein